MVITLSISLVFATSVPPTPSTLIAHPMECVCSFLNTVFFLIKFKFFLHNRTHFLFPASQSESTSNISICLSSVSSTVESSQVGVDVARKTSESHDDAGEGWFYRIRLPTKLIPA